MVETRGQLAEETILEIEEAFDIQSLDLSPEEGFLLSRIVGPKQTVKAVCEASGMSRKEVMPLLEQLVAKGVCVVKEPWLETEGLDDDDLLLAEAEACLSKDNNLSRRSIFLGKYKIDLTIDPTDEGMALGFIDASDDTDAIDLVSKDFQPLVAEDSESVLTHAKRARILGPEKNEPLGPLYHVKSTFGDGIRD